jgi:hypothetical protein
VTVELSLAALALVDSTSMGTIGVPVFLMLGRTDALVPRMAVYWMRRHSAGALGWALAIGGFLLTRDGLANLFFLP